MAQPPPYPTCKCMSLTFPYKNTLLSKCNKELRLSSTSQTTMSGSENESFHEFYECWMAEQNQHLKELLIAAAAADESTAYEKKLQALNERVVEHYVQYYNAKSRCAKQDVLAILSPTWLSSLGKAFLWIGGWRPSMAFHLLYSKSGFQFEARLIELIHGLRTHDLGDISASQLSQLDEMQIRAISEEREVADLMESHQETVAVAPLVELSHVVGEIEDKVESTLVPLVEGFEKILLKADELRLRTLKGIVSVLTPKQAIHFFISAAELHLSLHEWGKKMDSRKGNHGFGHQV